jgi:hypothetical protein
VPIWEGCWGFSSGVKAAFRAEYKKTYRPPHLQRTTAGWYAPALQLKCN